MAQSAYIIAITAFLLLSAVAHFLLPSQTSHWMSKPEIVRRIGAFAPALRRSLPLVARPVLLDDLRSSAFIGRLTALLSASLHPRAGE